MLLGIISLSLLVPFGANAAIDTNPSLTVINVKLETIARAKGIPSLLLKAVAFRESSWRQWDSEGKPLLSAGDHPAIGIMQIATYDDQDLEIVERLKNDIDFNIERGADLLNHKFDDIVPQIGNGDRNILENWYYAIWAYNCWVKDDMSKNNPHQTTSGQKTFQDSVLDLCAKNFIPSVPGAIKPVNISRPDLEDIPETGVPNPIATPAPIHYGDLTVEVERICGTDRIDTAVLIAREGWPDAVISRSSKASRRVVLARSDEFADALAGVPLAAKYDAPILITPPHEMDIRVLTEIQRLKPQEIILLGAEGALGKEIDNSLIQAGFSADQLVRIQGKDRYETSAAIAEIVGTSDGSAFIVTGENFPDALGAAGVAGEKGIPVVLMPSDHLNDSSLAVLERLDVQKVVVIGLNQTMCGLIKKELQEAPEVQVSSIRGVDRYATTVSVVNSRTEPVTEIILATGENYPDALAGAAFAVHRKAVLLLVPKTDLAEHSELISYLKNVGSGISQVEALGGSNIVNEKIIDQVKDILKT